MHTHNPFQEIAVRLSRIEDCLDSLKEQTNLLRASTTSELSDTCSLIQALEFLNERGYTISKSKIYKLTATNSIPHRRFGNRLVFSRKELLAWVEAQISEINADREATIQLARSANNKIRKGGKR